MLEKKTIKKSKYYRKLGSISFKLSVLKLSVITLPNMENIKKIIDRCLNIKFMNIFTAINPVTIIIERKEHTWDNLSIIITIMFNMYY